MSTSIRRVLGAARRRGAAALAALRGAPPSPAAEAAREDIAILDWYSKELPSAANAVGIFPGEWASRLPAPLEDVPAGSAPLFADPRISWCIERLAAGGRDGGVRGARVLELGPLEGGHSYMLETAGAASVTAIESNARSYLKCLVAKELLGLTRTSFAFGDFVPYLRGCAERYDVAVASGVIYHLLDPVSVIADLCAVTDDAIFVWTQYYDEEVIAARSDLHRKFGDRRTANLDGYDYELVEYRYLDALDFAGFCGGSAPTSNWLTRDGLTAAFARHGFADIEVHDDDRDHVHGPAITFLARRSGGVVAGA